MRIRPEQWTQFDVAIRSRYCQGLLKFYRDTIGETVAAYDDTTLLSRISAAEERGRQWGISLKDSMVRFIALDLVIGEGFDTTPDVRRLFHAPGMSMDMKVHLLTDLAQDHFRRDSAIERS